MGKLRHKYQNEAFEWFGNRYGAPEGEMQYDHEPCAILLQGVTGSQTVPVIRDADSGRQFLKWNRVRKVTKHMQERAEFYGWRVREALIEMAEREGTRLSEDEIRYILGRVVSSEEHEEEGYKMWLQYLVEDGFLEVEYRLADDAEDKKTAPPDSREYRQMVRQLS